MGKQRDASAAAQHTHDLQMLQVKLEYDAKQAEEDRRSREYVASKIAEEDRIARERIAEADREARKELLDLIKELVRQR